ncbi:MAG: phosphoserine phosphatase SerB [Nakamurella sp.]
MPPAGLGPAGGYGYADRWQLLLCDVDSTLISDEVIELLAARAGHLAEVEQVTSAAMSGSLDFADSLTRRVSLLEGLDAAVLDDVGRSLRLTPGAEVLIGTLQQHGVRCGIASGGFTQVCTYLVDRLHLDYCAANTLEIVEGRLTGRVVGAIVDRAGKATALREFAAMYGINMAATVAVGDGANDIDMVQAAGFSVAFNGKPALVPHTTVALNGPSLEPILDMLHSAAGGGSVTPR